MAKLTPDFSQIYFIYSLGLLLILFDKHEWFYYSYRDSWKSVLSLKNEISYGLIYVDRKSLGY